MQEKEKLSENRKAGNVCGRGRTARSETVRPCENSLRRERAPFCGLSAMRACTCFFALLFALTVVFPAYALPEASAQTNAETASAGAETAAETDAEKSAASGEESAQGAENIELLSGAEREAAVEIGALSEQEGIDLNLYYGYQNTAKSGKFLPVSIEIENHTETDLSGMLELSVSEGDTVLRYRFPAAVSAGRTETVRGTISVTGQAEEAVLRFYGNDENLLTEKRTALNVRGSESELLVGILSNTPQELSYFRGLSIAGTALRTRTVTLNPPDMPETEEGLSQLDLIIISNFNMQKLSEETVQVICDWVESGGVLLLGTGGTRNPLGAFADHIEGLEVGLPETRKVDMGLKYSTDGPDGAMIDLSVSSIYADDGIQAIQSEDLAVLTTISRGSGVIGLAAYDLCDIKEFCTEQIGYTDDLLQALLGSARIKELSAGSGSEQAEYETLHGLVNLWDPAHFPNMSFYFAVAASYVLLIGPGCWFFLRQRGLALYYPAAVMLCSVSAAAVLWMLGLKTRFERPVLDYAVILERSGDKENETEIISLFTPLKQEVTVRFSPDYQIQPVLSEMETAAAGSAEALLRTVRGTENSGQKELIVSMGAEEKRIEANGLKPFEDRIFELYRSGEVKGASAAQGDAAAHEASDKTEDAAAGGISLSADIRYFDDRLSGSITNDGTEDLSGAALLLHGRVVLIGELAAGETIDLSGSEAVFAPTGSPKLTSEYITGISGLSAGSEAYVTALSRTRLLRYYMEEELDGYFGGGKILAFSESETEAPASVRSEGVSCHGTTLFIEEVSVDFGEGREVYRSALSGEPKVVSGEYEAGSNTTSGAAAVVLEYSLGSDLSIASLKFNSLSEIFSGKTEENGQHLIPFRGTRSLYNYQTSSYDMLSSSKTSFDGAEIQPYLSPSNTITVRYQPDENAAEGNLMFLPVPAVTGEEF